MATPATHPAPLTDAPLRRQNPREEPSALDAHAEICAGAASNGGPYRDPETKCGASAVLDTGPAFTILGCRKPAWRRSGRAVSGQRGAWISSSPDSPDASGDASFAQGDSAYLDSDLRWYYAMTPNQTAPSKWVLIAFAVPRRFLRPFITSIGANSLKMPFGVISSS